MFRLILTVLCLLFISGACDYLQKPESIQTSGPSDIADEPAAETVGGSADGAAAAGDFPAEDRDSLCFVMVQFSPGIPFQVDSVQSDGSLRIRIHPSERWVENFARSGISASAGGAMLSQLTEGYFLGLSGLPESDDTMIFADIQQGRVTIDKAQAFRIQVVRVEAGGQAACRIGPAAARQLKKGDTFLLVRPAGSTTAQLQAAPDLISIVDGATEPLGMNPNDVASLIRSINNLKRIGIAMHNFHSTHRCFPPAAIYGPDGKPWHSWRVLLLPFVDQQALYEQYRFDEPWDGPNNKQLIEQVPSVYRDPIHGETGDGYTHYAVAVGERTGFSAEGYTLPKNATARAWQGSDRSLGGRSMAKFKDGTANTLLAGSVNPERKIPWTKPEDVVFNQQFPGLGKESGFAAPYETKRGSGGMFVFADGSVHAIRDDIDIAVLRNLVQIDDRQPIGKFPELQPDSRPRGQSVLLLTIPRDKPGAPAKLTIEHVRSAYMHIPTGTAAAPADSEAARKFRSSVNLKQLGLAIHYYHDAFNRFPPAYTTDESGKPLLSWRVLVLPYMDQQKLWKEFRLDEPWDSEHNKRLIAKMPDVFRSPNSKAEPGRTVYLGVGGPQSIFPGNEKVALRDVFDGASNTIMVVEASDTSAVIWTKPDDFVPDAEDPGKGLGGLWSSGFHGLFSDGSVRFLNETTDGPTLRALFTRGASEVIDRSRVGAIPQRP